LSGIKHHNYSFFACNKEWLGQSNYEDLASFKLYIFYTRPNLGASQEWGSFGESLKEGAANSVELRSF
jgi:hypothetical protein